MLSSSVDCHVVSDYTGSELRVYINGLQAGSVTVTAPAGNANTFGIGRISPGRRVLPPA
mgnify:CR=1 FL=1